MKMGRLNAIRHALALQVMEVMLDVVLRVKLAKTFEHAMFLKVHILKPENQSKLLIDSIFTHSVCITQILLII